MSKKPVALRWKRLLRFPPAITTSGSGDRVAPTSNDAGDQSPIGDPSLLADADRGAAAPVEVSAEPRSVLSTAPWPG